MRNRSFLMATLLAAPVASTAFAAPTISAQDASIAAAGATITAQRVPVQIGAGAPTYFDVTITLGGVEVNGVIGNVKASATSTPSQIFYTNHFVAGTYKDVSGNVYTVSGPGVGPGGATSWSIAYVSGGKGCILYGATWYTDTGSNNPEYARLKADKIPTTAYSFGVSGGESACASNYLVGHLVGAVQSNKGLSISSYTNYQGYDQATPVATLQVTLQY